MRRHGGRFVAAVFFFCAGMVSAQHVTIDFEDLPGMNFVGWSPVESASVLSNQWASTYGVTFTSGDVMPFVVVVRIGSSMASSGVNGVGGVNVTNNLDYASPIKINFVSPADPTKKAYTDFVSINTDKWPLGSGTVTMEAYGLSDDLLDSVTVTDDEPHTLSISHAGIHAIRLTQSTATVAFDNLVFNTLSSANVTLNNLSQTYNGTPRTVTATTIPDGLSTTITYNGSATPPTSAGDYTVIATITDPVYANAVTGTLSVAKANQTIEFPALANQLATATVPLTATASSGLLVHYAVAGPAVLNGATLAFTGPGSVSVTAVQFGDVNWNAAAPVTHSFQVTRKRMVDSDFDGDGRSDIGCYYAPSGNWYFFQSTEGFKEAQFGFAGTLPVTGDFDGDGRTDFGCYYPPSGNWCFFQSTEGFKETQFGYEGTLPVTGDFDGDGTADFGCYHPPSGNWYFFASTRGFGETQFGFAGTLPVTGDFDGDNFTDFGCYHPASGNWYLLQSTDGHKETQFGYEGTLPIVGDFDGDGRDDFGCYHPPSGNWYFFQSTEGFKETQFGYEGTLPVTGDFDGDGTADFGCYHPPSGNWYLMQSTEGFRQTTFGYAGTVPVKSQGAATEQGTPRNLNSGSLTLAGDATTAADPSGNNASGNLTLVVIGAVNIRFSDLRQTYDGTPRPVTVTTVPEDLEYIVTYDGDDTPPTDAGDYTVIATINHPVYVGSVTGTLSVAKANQTIEFAALADQFTSATVPLKATATSGLPATYTLAGPAVLSGDALAFTGRGSVSVTATQPGDANWNAAPSVTHSFYVDRKRMVASDFDGDRRSDLVCYNAPGGNWYFFQSTEGFKEAQFGFEGALPVTGDFDGDGRTDFGCYHPASGNWCFFQSTEGFKETQFGFDGTLPVTGDFDGDGRDDFGCYHPPSGNWYFFTSTRGVGETQFGFADTLPITGDFDDDGLTDFGCYHPPSGNWYLLQSTDGYKETQFGYEGTLPIIGDFDGDGRDDFGCYHPPSGNWYFFQSTEGFKETQFGYEGTLPVVGDYDGDGTADFGCYHPPSGNWYLIRSTRGFYQTNFGYDGTVPLQ